MATTETTDGSGPRARPAVAVRPLREEDVPAADRIMRLAFGTFLGLPEPLAFGGDAAHVQPRWRADPMATLGAEVGGELVGSNVATNWGSVGFFGPLTVRPDLWDQGVATQLLEATMAYFDAWGTTHAGLFTFPQSARHLHLYQKFDFWPRFLTPIMVKPVVTEGQTPTWTGYAGLAEGERAAALHACRELAEAVYPGLDLTREIHAADDQGLGDTVLVWDTTRLLAFAVCHAGPGSEAGTGTCYIKFGAARPGPEAGAHFDRLLAACEALAVGQGAARLVAGVNMGCHEAYLRLLARGFRTDMEGIAMQRRNDAGYHRPGVYVIDDWR